MKTMKQFVTPTQGTLNLIMHLCWTCTMNRNKQIRSSEIRNWKSPEGGQKKTNFLILQEFFSCTADRERARTAVDTYRSQVSRKFIKKKKNKETKIKNKTKQTCLRTVFGFFVVVLFCGFVCFCFCLSACLLLFFNFPFHLFFCELQRTAALLFSCLSRLIC